MARFPNTYCSQCGRSFGPGDHGYSHCSDHTELHNPCLRCEAAEITQSNYCDDCAEWAAEGAAERALEGEPPVSVRERAEMAWRERRAERGD